MYTVQVRIVSKNEIRVLQGKVNTDTLRRLRTLHGSNNVTIVID